MELPHAPTSLPFRPSRMFLKTVPPVVAIHSEWRSNKSCSLPLFFNDSASDSDLASVSGTPIPQKIQMIIESLHSTQSSDMSENMQTEKAAHSSHEAGYKGQMRLMDTSARSRRTGQTLSHQPPDLILVMIRTVTIPWIEALRRPFRSI